MYEPTPPQGLLTTTEAAKILCVSPRTLEHWRRVGRGPTYARLEGQVRYTPHDVEAFIQSNRVEASA